MLLTVSNLRGVRESGIVFALPTYSFVVVMYMMIGTGVGKCAAGACPQAHVPDPITAGAAGSVGVLVVLRAFASGAAALTGVEAISNGVSAFSRRRGGTRRRRSLVMGGMAISLFVGVSCLAVHMHARPSERCRSSPRSRAATFPAGSAGVVPLLRRPGPDVRDPRPGGQHLVSGFPRLGAVLARDRFFPRQFVNLGDRLVYSNGIIVLAGLASLLIWAFKAERATRSSTCT